MAIVKTTNVLSIHCYRLDQANNSFYIDAEVLVSIDDPNDDELPIRQVKKIRVNELDNLGNPTDLSLAPALVAKVANTIFSANTDIV